MSRFWYNYGESITAVLVATLAVLAIMFGIIGGITALERGNIKYNCQLDTHPGWYLTFRIDSTPYAYEPEKFCANVRNLMSGENK